MIIPPSYLKFLSSPGVGLISPLTFKKGERRRKKTYIHIFPSFIDFDFFDF